MRNKKQKPDPLEIFASAPIPKAVLTNALPAMLGMLMVLIYNMADMFFVGQTHNALMVAAVSLATPVFLIFMGIGNIFGLGGTSVISRALGQGRKDFASNVSSFCIWSCIAVGIIMCISVLTFCDSILKFIGASADTWEYAKEYLVIVSYAGPFFMISTCFSNIIRSEGKPGIAMAGQVIGNLVNIILDPILILGLNMGVAGAALATTISNIVSALIYLAFLLSKQNILSISPRDFSAGHGVLTGVFAIGIPASLGNLLMSFSQILSNSRIASHGNDMAVAGYGVAMKITMITGILCIGFTAGVQPLLGYCIGAKNYKRFKKALAFTAILANSLTSLLTLFCYIFTNQLAGLFLVDPDALMYAVKFSRIIISTGFIFGLFFTLSATLQAMGEAGSALIINLSRQGFVYIPLMFVLDSVFGVDGLVWAQPVADILATTLVIILYTRAIRRLERSAKAETEATEPINVTEQANATEQTEAAK
ncbi:MAG: MATE family efflux transporter [Eubacteriales bacterium]|nr:MATE family efflux transporter [Eubacteriales bacterium]